MNVHAHTGNFRHKVSKNGIWFIVRGLMLNGTVLGCPTNRLEIGASFPFCCITDSFSSINVSDSPTSLAKSSPTSVSLKAHRIDYIHFTWRMNTLITFLCL